MSNQRESTNEMTAAQNQVLERQFKDLEASMTDISETVSGTGPDTAGEQRPLDAESMELLELFTYTQQKINDHLEKVFAVDNLSLAHYRALFFVLRYDGISVSGLIDKLDITKQSLARVLADLIRGRGPLAGEPAAEIEDDENPSGLISDAEGYLYSEVDPNDRRARRLHLTERGHELMHDALEPVTEALKNAFGDGHKPDTMAAQNSKQGER